MGDQSYLGIGEYSIIGNLETAALVGANGSIDWLPVPHVESSSLFAGGNRRGQKLGLPLLLDSRRYDDD